MLSSEDLERFYFQYQTEAVPLGMSVQTFCLRNNVPDGVPSGPPSESGPSSPSGETPVKKDSPSPHAVHRYRKPGKGPGTLPVRISVELTLSNGLHILQKDLDYPGLYRLIQKLEVLC
ncbi:hypothetical protein [Phocaeicola vulgatus]|uniref:hypothetical protein n=1 Tax=Phocaeicola vulgatus TaxID=821 RepID=UPI0027E017B5|nr:hypothetical protein [Phocaeicola vulgatus]